MRFTRFIGLLLLVSGLGMVSVQAQGYSASYKFLKAVKDLDYREIKMAVEKGVNINTRDYDDKSTPLVIAARKKATPLVNYLLANGAKPNMHGEDGKTALIIAAGFGDKTMAAVLLKYEADINLADNNGITPLMAAVMSKKNQVVRLLLDFGADVELEDYSGRSALQHAIDNRHRKSQKLLKAAGAVAN